MLNRVDLARLERVTLAARRSPRQRMNDNLHAMDDPIHRLLNATEPNTYVRPHRHLEPPNTESLCVLTGRGAVLVFDDAGELVERALLGTDAPYRVVEVPSGAWHSLVALEPGTVWFEVKAGPYAPPPPADIASWAPPPEDEAAAADYLERLRALATG